MVLLKKINKQIKREDIEKEKNIISSRQVIIIEKF